MAEGDSGRDERPLTLSLSPLRGARGPKDAAWARGPKGAAWVRGPKDDAWARGTDSEAWAWRTGGSAPSGLLPPPARGGGGWGEGRRRRQGQGIPLESITARVALGGDASAVSMRPGR